MYDRYLHDKVQQRIDTVVQDVKTKAQDEIRDKANELADEIIEESFGDNEFMKQFVIDGVNLLERFLESVGKVIGKDKVILPKCK